MPVWFVPALVFVARTAAPFVARSLVRNVGASTARALAAGGIGSGANLITQAVDHGTDWSEYQIKSALWDGALTAASTGAGIALFGPLTKKFGTTALRRFAVEMGGTLAVTTGLTMGRIVLAGADPWESSLAAYGQTGFTYARRRFLITRLVPKRGLDSLKGVLIDQGISFPQELIARFGAQSAAPHARRYASEFKDWISGSSQPSSRGSIPRELSFPEDPSGAALDAPPACIKELDFDALYRQVKGESGGEMSYGVALKLAQAMMSGMIKPVEGDAPGHDETYRWQRYLKALDFYRGRLDGDWGGGTTHASNNYAISQLRLKLPRGAGMRDRTPVTQLAYLKTMVGESIDPRGRGTLDLPGDRGLTGNERIGRTQARESLKTLELWYEKNVGSFPPGYQRQR